jgi:hypothetical protein
LDVGIWLFDRFGTKKALAKTAGWFGYWSAEQNNLTPKKYGNDIEGRVGQVAGYDD